MKMHTGLFWGVVLIVIGILLVVKVIVPFHFPIFKILFGLFVIYIGITIVVGGTLFSGKHFFRSHGKEGKTVFANARVDSSTVEDKNSVVFGNVVYDFTGVTADSTTRELKVDVAFGGAEVLLPKNVPVKVQCDVSFGKVALPNGNVINFGSGVYIGGNFSNDTPHLHLVIDVAFGEVVVKE